MTGMALLVCCIWTVLLCLSVQAYGKVDIHTFQWTKYNCLRNKCSDTTLYVIYGYGKVDNELNTIVLGMRILDEDEEISVKGALWVNVTAKTQKIHFIAIH